MKTLRGIPVARGHGIIVSILKDIGRSDAYRPITIGGDRFKPVVDDEPERRRASYRGWICNNCKSTALCTVGRVRKEHHDQPTDVRSGKEGNAKRFGAGTPPSSINFAAIEISIIDGAENSGLFDFETPSRIISPYISLSVFR